MLASLSTSHATIGKILDLSPKTGMRQIREVKNEGDGVFKGRGSDTQPIYPSIIGYSTTASSERKSRFAPDSDQCRKYLSWGISLFRPLTLGH